MTKAARCVAAAIGAAVLAGIGCASRPAPEPFRPEVVVGDQAAIYLYRTRGMGGPVRVAMDGQDIGDLGTGQYLVRLVTPGEHIVRAEGGSSVARSVRVIAGEAGYVEVSTGGFGRHPTLTTPDDTTARARIAGLTRVP